MLKNLQKCQGFIPLEYLREDKSLQANEVIKL